MRNRTWLLALGGSVVAAHILLLAGALPLVVRAMAALVIAGVAPAILLSALLLPARGETPRQLLERAVFVAALAFTSITAGMLLLSFLPGAIERWQVLAFYDLGMVALAAGLWWMQRGRADSAVEPADDSPPAPRPSLLVPLLVLLIVAGALRFINLGYAEFHGDESRAPSCVRRLPSRGTKTRCSSIARGRWRFSCPPPCWC